MKKNQTKPEQSLSSPPSFSSLAVLEKGMVKLQTNIRKKTIDLVYDVVAFGLHLLKAKQIHQSDHLTRFGAQKPPSEAAQSSGADTVSAPEGYHAWIEEKFPDLNERTARRYANAALNAGFTAESDLKAVARLRKTKALHAKQLSDLYRSPKLLTDSTEPEPEKETYDLIRETIAALGEQCDAIIALREQLKPKQYEAVIDRLHETLQLLTGTKWDQVEGDLKIIPAA